MPRIRNLRKSNGEHWNKDELTLALQVGMTPNGDFLGDTMAEVVEHTTGNLTDDDRAAMATYLLSLD